MTERANPLIAARDNASLRKLEKRLAVPAHAERQQQNISDLETHILLSSRHFGFNLLDPLQDRHDANHGGAMHEKVAAPKCCAAGAENIRLPSTELFPLTMVYSKAIASRFAYHSKDETIKTIMFYRPFQTGSQVLTSIFLYLSSCRGCAGLRCVFFLARTHWMSLTMRCCRIRVALSISRIHCLIFSRNGERVRDVTVGLRKLYLQYLGLSEWVHSVGCKLSCVVEVDSENARVCHHAGAPCRLQSLKHIFRLALSLLRSGIAHL
jgi:hypothetical protein